MERWTEARRVRVAQRLTVAAAVAATLAVRVQAAVVVAVVFVVVVPCERLYPRHRQRLLRPQLGTDLAYALLSGPLKAVGLVVGLPLAVVSLMWVPGLALRPLVLALPGPARTAVGFVLFDLMSYWGHRWMHRVPLLWRFHAIHHSSRRLDWLAGFRVHPLDGMLLAPVFVLLMAAGFDGKLTGVLVVARVGLDFFIHANVRWRLRPMQRLVITPEFHHWHHSDDPQARDGNFAAFLPVWDLLFGTWFMPPDRRPSGYGIDEPMPEGLVAQVLHPLPDGRTVLGALRHPVRSARRAGTELRVVARQIRQACRPAGVTGSR
jgi:sterol desaturase/sphingolipid hydroxylase (fatty acid hydroxylase superfamily)